MVARLRPRPPSSPTTGLAVTATVALTGLTELIFIHARLPQLLTNLLT
jgi:hypothetical protein